METTNINLCMHDDLRFFNLFRNEDARAVQEAIDLKNVDAAYEYKEYDVGYVVNVLA